ncbi:MAG: pyruvate kinase [Fibrobacterales bacterium]
MQKKTKIVCTISDRKCDVPFLTELYASGMNVVRINTAHQLPETTVSVLENIYAVDGNIAILVDTKGPEVRTGELDDAIDVKTGDKVTVECKALDGVKTTKEVLQVNYPSFAKDVPVGTQILIDDGYLELRVDSKTDEKLECTIMNDGEFKRFKSVNVPGVAIKLPSLTEKDKNFIKFACDHDLDFIAHSFVRHAQDVKDVQAIIDESGKDVKIISKIENQEGVDNIDEIIEESYGIMVARGDMGIEVPGEKVPQIQKMIINKCIQAGKPVITATQMLESMIKNPRATRAEISDVANAVLDGTDAIMLSGETAYGDYPVEAVSLMTRISKEVESTRDELNPAAMDVKHIDIKRYVGKAAVKAAQNLDVKALVVPTATGKTARDVASYRSKAPVYAACIDGKGQKILALSYGVEAFPITREGGIRQNAVSALIKDGKLANDDLITMIISTLNAPGGNTNNMEINVAGNCVK